MSFNINNASLTDSISFATSIHEDFFPGGETPVQNTSASKSRPMVGQTLSARTLSDVINGDSFFRSPKYAVAAMNKSVSSSLNNLITGSGSIASAGTVENPIVSVSNPESQGDPKDPNRSDSMQLTGGAAINRIFASSLVGKNFSSSFVSQAVSNLQQIMVDNYSKGIGGNGSGQNSGDISGSTESQSAGMRNVAFTAELSEEEKGWYEERIALLRSKYPNHFADTRFIFDIPNHYGAADITVYNGEDTSFPNAKVPTEQRIISKEIVMQTPTEANAFVCPALIELIIFLHEHGIILTGGFDAGRQWGMKLNEKEQLWLSDHTSGRAVDISSVGRENAAPIALSGGVSRDVYDGALEILLDGLAEAPQYLLPDLLCIHQDYANGYGVDNSGNNDAQTCVFKIARPWLQYVNFFADNRDYRHSNHIHLSFSGMRAGKYTGPGGQMGVAGTTTSTSTNAGTSSSSGITYIEIPGIGVVAYNPQTTAFAKNYYGDWGANLGQDAVFQLLSTTIASKEVAAIMAALTARESGGGNPTSCNPNTLSGDFMSLGMFQINMGVGGFRESSDGTISRKSGAGAAHGKKVYEITDSNGKEQIQGWQLASKNWTTVFPGEQPPTIDNYNEKLNEKNKFYRAEAESQGKTGNARYNYVVEKLRELVDHRVWIPNNQAYMLYTMRTGVTPYFNFPKLGMSPETGYHFVAWGDGYKEPYGWLTGGVKFEDAARVYENGGGKAEDLKQWIKDVYQKDPAVQLPIVANYSAKYINDWLEGAVYP